MYQPQQGNLGEAYYGPPIPPQPYPPRRRGNCFATLVKIFVALCIVFGVVLLVLLLVLRPNKIKVAVESAELTRFNLTADPTTSLAYNLTSAISIRNPNKRIGVYYDGLEAYAYYDGERFDWTALPAFYQGHKNTTTLRPVIEGTSFVALGSSGVSDFRRDNSTGFFDIDVWINGRIRYRLGSSAGRRHSLRVKCPLRLQLETSPAPAGAGFRRTECDVIDF